MTAIEVVLLILGLVFGLWLLWTCGWLCLENIVPSPKSLLRFAKKAKYDVAKSKEKDIEVQRLLAEAPKVVHTDPEEGTTPNPAILIKQQQLDEEFWDETLVSDRENIVFALQDQARVAQGKDLREEEPVEELIVEEYNEEVMSRPSEAKPIEEKFVDEVKKEVTSRPKDDTTSNSSADEAKEPPCVEKRVYLCGVDDEEKVEEEVVAVKEAAVTEAAAPVTKAVAPPSVEGEGKKPPPVNEGAKKEVDEPKFIEKKAYVCGSDEEDEGGPWKTLAEFEDRASKFFASAFKLDDETCTKTLVFPKRDDDDEEEDPASAKKQSSVMELYESALAELRQGLQLAGQSGEVSEKAEKFKERLGSMKDKVEERIMKMRENEEHKKNEEKREDKEESKDEEKKDSD